MFGEVVVAFAPVVVPVAVVVVGFVAVAMPSEASGSIEALLLFSVLAKPEYGVKVKLAISVEVRNGKITKLIFWGCLVDIHVTIEIVIKRFCKLCIILNYIVLECVFFIIL
jgi:hypothetical protein